MHSTRILRSGAALAGAVLAATLMGLLAPVAADAQDIPVFNHQKAVGTALYYRWGFIEVEAPKTAPVTPTQFQTKGLIDVLPEHMPLQGPTLGMSFGDWGIVAAYSLFQADIHRKADLNGDGVGDVDVLAVQGHTTSLSLLYQPIRHLFIGYGWYQGTMTFQIVDAGGVGSTVKSSTHGNFYTFALAWGIDPTVRRSSLFFAIYATPAAGDSGEVANSTYGMGLWGRSSSRPGCV